MITYSHDAIFRAYPQAVKISDTYGAFDANDNKIELDPALVNAAAAEIEAEFAASKYQRQRAEKYPSLKDFADAYYWAQKGDNKLMDAYVAACDKVKADYPKP